MAVSETMIGIRIQHLVMAALKERARATDRPMSWVVRKYINEGLERDHGSTLTQLPLYRTGDL